MMPYNPPRYDELLQGAGLTVAKDLLAFAIDRNMNVERIRRIAVRIESRYGVKIRTLDMANFDKEIAILQDIYNDVWEENWGFSPMSSEEFRHMAAELKPLVDPDLVFIAEIDGRPVAFSLVVPDYFEALRHLNGRIMNPWALLKLFVYTKIWPKLKGFRILALGVRKRYRNLGLGTSFYSRVFDIGTSKGYVSAEASWILEDNRQMVSALEVMGARPYKRYRIYSGQLKSGES
jgi:GNAT superfamily N-acetyltransferase